MESRQKKRLGDMLIEEQIISDEQLSDALEKKKGTTKRLGEVLVELGYTSETDIAKALSRQLGLEIVSLSGIQIEENVLKLVDVAVLRKYVMVPIGFSPNNMNEVRVAMADPMDMRGIDDFSIITNLQVTPLIATTHDIMLTLDRFYGSSEARKVAEAYALERRQEEQREQEREDDEDIANSPIVLLVNAMIEQAARQRASDIHIEALESRVRIRYRIDGVLYEKASYDIRLLNAITARIKIIGGMDISEKRKPQDGRITLVVDRVEYDIRVSILPTVYGEKCVLRLAQKKALTKDKRELGFTPGELESFDRMLKHPNGILLVTGPTGSGKSTTLYTALSELNTEDINIITVEDPVEANLDGVNQVQVNAKADMTFASALRSILRQDPDIIFNTIVAAYKTRIKDPAVKILESGSRTSAEKEAAYVHTDNAIGNKALENEVTFYYMVTDSNLVTSDKDISVDYSMLDKNGNSVALPVQATDGQVYITTEAVNGDTVTTDSAGRLSGLKSGEVYKVTVHNLTDTKVQEAITNGNMRIAVHAVSTFDYYGDSYGLNENAKSIPQSSAALKILGRTLFDLD